MREPVTASNVVSILLLKTAPSSLWGKIGWADQGRGHTTNMTLIWTSDASEETQRKRLTVTKQLDKSLLCSHPSCLVSSPRASSSVSAEASCANTEAQKNAEEMKDRNVLLKNYLPRRRRPQPKVNTDSLQGWRLPGHGGDGILFFSGTTRTLLPRNEQTLMSERLREVEIE